MAEGTTREISAGPRRIFERKEVKFPMAGEKYGKLIDSLSGRLMEDEYGNTTVISVYYDSDDLLLIGRSADKPLYKEKFRVRSYGVPDDESTVFAEIKKKYDGIVYKRRVEGKYREIMDMLDGKVRLGHHGQIQDEIQWMMERYSLKPAVLIAYDRTAYTSPSDPGLRITFDSDVRYRLSDLDMRNGDCGTPLREEGFRVMEIKTSGSMPLWLADKLTENGIFPGSFSKIGSCFEQVIVPAYRSGTYGRYKNA